MSRRSSVKTAWQHSHSGHTSSENDCDVENQIPLGRNSLRYNLNKTAEKRRLDREHIQRHRYTVGARNHGNSHHSGDGNRARGDSVASVCTEPNSVALSCTVDMEQGPGLARNNTDHPETKEKMQLGVLKKLRKSEDEMLKMKKSLREYYQYQAEFIDFVVEFEQSQKDEELREELQKDINQLLEDEKDKAINGSSVAIEIDEGCSAPTNILDDKREKEKEQGNEPSQTANPSQPIISEKEKKQKKINRMIKLSINASFIANIFLLLIKVYAAATSGSLAVIASSIDSVMDLISGSVVWLANLLANRRNYYAFPVGKSRYEPIAIIVFAALMGVAAIQLISEGAQSLGAGQTDSSVDTVTLVIMGIIIVTKGTLMLYCNQVKKYSSSVAALALDHMSDVMTNSATLIAIALAAKYSSVWFLDPAAAIALALWIIYLWSSEALEQIKLIASQSATPAQISQLTYVALKHDDEHVQHVDTVLAYTVGNRLQAEVDIVLPEDMKLSVAHDIGEALQHKLEKLEFVERAFVHLDTEYDHSRSIEHICPYDRS